MKDKTGSERRAVVVGVDGSDAAQAALAHGAWEAHRRGAVLRLVHSHGVVAPYGVIGFAPDPSELTRAAKAGAELLADYEVRAQVAFPELDIECEVVADSPGGALVAASARAELVVVGSRGLGGFAGLLLGSVGTQLAAHSRCPVIVVRPPDDKGALGVGPAHRPVVVGIDGVSDGTSALTFAFDEASARGVPLLALYAWWMLPPSDVGPMAPRHYDLTSAGDEARRLLAEATAGWRENYPDVEVSLVPAHSMNPTVALLELSQDAGLLVVSRHGGNALTRLLFGSVGDIAVREAACPVAVVPEQST
jgi:nucleotide-binding universal stress UspA family protein